MSDQLSKVAPFWEWKEKQKAIDDEANGGVPLLRSKDWYHREYGKYVATIQRQGYASFNKGTLTVDVGQFLKDTRSESATTTVDVAPIAWRFDYCGVKPMVWLEKPAENAPMFTNIRALVYADDYATLARQLAKSERDCAELRALLTAQNAAIARTDDLARQLAEANSELAMHRVDATRVAACPWRVQKGHTSECQPPKRLQDALDQLAEAKQVQAWVRRMKTSKGDEYWVCVGYPNGKNITPNYYSIRGRAEFDVAEWNHLFGRGPKPDILAFDTDERPPTNNNEEPR